MKHEEKGGHSRKLGEPEHVLGQLLDGVLNGLGAAVNNVNAVISRVLNLLLHVAPKASQIGGH